MMISLRNALVGTKKLPYDCEVEWIAAPDYGPYIRTGYVPASNAGLMTFDIMVRQNIAFSTNVGMIGARDGTNTRTCWAIPYNNGGFQVGYENVYYNLITGNTITGKDVRLLTTLSASNCVFNLSVSGSDYSWSTPRSSFSCNQDIWLFANNNSGSPLFVSNATFVGRMYYCKLYDNGVLVRDFVPVRKGGVGYMYDRVSGQLFGNQGSGNFVVGPDVVEVEYIGVGNSVGPYIDTGYAWQSNDIKIECDFVQTESANRYTGLFGSQKNEVDTNWGIQLWHNSAGYDVQHYIGSSARVYTWTVSQNTRYKFIGETTLSNAWSISINGDVHTGTWSGSVCDNVSTVGLFTLSNGSNMTSRRTNNVNVYAFRLMDNGVLVRDFVPVRVGMEGAMMDRLTRKIYRNQGTGNFSYGADK